MTQQELEKLRFNIALFRGELDGVMNRPNPYPESVFREPDWREVNQVLEASGINMTGVNGSIGRMCYKNIQADVKALDTSLLNNIEDALIRLEKLEAAVTWHGWDEVPDGTDLEIRIEVRTGNGSIRKFIYHTDKKYFTQGKSCIRETSMGMTCAGYTGWRYPVEDLSE